MVLTTFGPFHASDDQPSLSTRPLRSNPQLLQLGSNQMIPLLPKSLWVVKKGVVKLTADTEDGDCLLLGLVGSEEVFGASLTDVETFTATTLSPCELTCLSLDEIASSTDLTLLMMRAIASRLRQSEALLSIVGQRRVEDRVRCFLELVANDHGVVTPHGIHINLRLTHQDIANAVSSTRVTVTRVLSCLKKKGWLRSSSQRHLMLTH